MSTHGYEWVSLTTDYGTRDGFVAACKGVLARLAPSARTLDVTHEVPPQAVTAGAAVLAQTVGYLPRAVHLVVVDPGVGTARRGVAVSTAGGVLVGPDNGVLLPAADALGGAESAVELSDRRWWLPTVSRTFHGRDIFAPAAAAVATGVDPAELGEPVPIAELVTAPTGQSTVDSSAVRADIVTVDHFGNLQLVTDAADAPFSPGQRLRVRVGQATLSATFARTFAEVPVGQCLVLADSAGHLAVAVNGGSAARELIAEHGHTAHITVDDTARQQ